MTQRLDRRVSVLMVTITTVVTVFVISISLGLAFRAAMAETYASMNRKSCFFQCAKAKNACSPKETGQG